MNGRLLAVSVRWIALAIATVVGSTQAGAQSICAPASRALTASPVDAPGVMNRRVSLHGRGVPLREALDRLAAAARVRLSYTAELLDLSRPVCLEYKAVAVADVLADLLQNAPVKPIALGDEQIVLAPASGVASSPEAAPMIKSVGMLNRVVVTGSTVGASQRSLPIALDVVSGQQLSQRAATSLSGALDGAVPGVWLWEQSPLSLLARYGSIRGASSFGVSYPKVYVDGIEVANSLLVTHLDPETIARIEVIRGPQGAALYGADAISGVMNIVTRQEGTEGGAPRAEIQTRGGASASEYSTGSVLAQSHGVSLRAGSGVKSARVGVTLNTIGAFIPEASSRQITAGAGGRLVGSRGIMTGTFRLFAQDAETPLSPLITDQRDSPLLPAFDDSTDRQSVRQYTAGLTGSWTANDRWTHSAIVGVDGYTLRSAELAGGLLQTAIDSALRAARGNAIRTTLRTSSVGQFGNPYGNALTVTLAAEHSFVRDETQNAFGAPVPAYGESPQPLVETRTNIGFVGQVNASLKESFFVSGGMRVERNTGLDGIGELAALPMVGVSGVRSFPGATVKLRAAYGKGIRPAQTSSRAGSLMGLKGAAIGAPLSPEEQSGVELGGDVFIGEYGALHVTRFDQRASGLIQPVGIYAAARGAGTLPTRIAYELQNVGEITNRGWELQGSLGSGPWSLGATFSQVDSRVRKIAAGYTGDLSAGDRMLEVPSRTVGMNAGYSQSAWWASMNVSRASDWVNYDRLALLTAFAAHNHQLNEFVGPELRSYWRAYDGVTRLGARVGVSVRRGMSFTLDGENLLNEQRGEPDNVTVLPGRTLSAGLRLSF